jgi:hypothetical protein
MRREPRLFGRWLTVRVIARGLRDGALSSESALRTIGRTHPHRDAAWRLAVLEDAQARLARHGQGKRR